MGVWVGEYRPTIVFIHQKMRKKSTSFDTNIVLGSVGANMVLNKKLTKTEITWIEIAWVQAKLNKYPQ